MDSFLQLVLLAIVQGVAEFLPISSSGHLVVAQALMGLENPDENLFVAIVLHAGTLVAIIAYYFTELLALLRRRDWRTMGLVIAATLPVVIVGLLFKDMLEAQFTNLPVVTGCFVFTAFMLLVVHRRANTPGTRLANLSWRQALWIGLMQCIAILPGVSRSGTTIATATRTGMDKEDAARFSFYLGIPAIGGAAFLDAIKVVTGEAPPIPSPIALLVAFAVSAVVGYASLVLLIRALKSSKFAWFGYYCLAMAMVLTIVQLVR